MVREPGLASLVFPPNPIAHQQAIVGVAIPLDHLDVHVLATDAKAGVGIGRNSFDAQVELGCARKMREVKAGTDGGVARRRDGEDVIVYFRIGIEGQPLAR